MGTKTVRLDDDVYERIKARKSDDETFSETIERLVGGPSLLELAGILTDDEADVFRAAIQESHDAHNREIDEMLEEQE